MVIYRAKNGATYCYHGGICGSSYLLASTTYHINLFLDQWLLPHAHSSYLVAAITALCPVTAHVTAVRYLETISCGTVVAALK